jgi:hypothetical protein
MNFRVFGSNSALHPILDILLDREMRIIIEIQVISCLDFIAQK